jgi:electron transfer flavoprotein alpha subunit
MAKILIVSELNQELPKNVTLEILGKCKGHQVDVAFVGKGPSDAGAKLLAEYGAQSIHVIKSDKLNSYSAEGYSAAVQGVVKSGGYQYVFTGATAAGKDYFPRLSAELQTGLASDVTNFTWEGDKFFGTRPFFAGKCLAKVEMQGNGPHLISIRPNALGMPTDKGAAGAGKVADAAATIGDIKALVSSVIKAASTKVDLSEANVIVSGGRAMKNAENFKILDELADVIGATVGASRAAVDSGFAPHAMQVGQTGKTVSPSLYIACGISGSIQHLAGMRTSKVIVAINTDPEAPIFTRADYGIVGDLFKIVPMLTQEFKNILGK